MNPLQFLYEPVDVLKDGANGKISLVYDKVGKQFFIMKERDLKTAEIYSRLKEIKSPYLPEIFHAIEFDGKFFIVEEFIQGRTLQEILTQNNGLDEKKSAEVLIQLCNALKVLHAQKIIHRDIKPSNIIVTKNFSVKLIDFNISRIEKENRETDTDFLGTRGYAPPEQYGFGQTDARSDIFSLGVTIQKILGEDYDGYLKKILAKCTELNPANRYQSAEEILADVPKKFFLHKAKTAATKLIATGAIIFLSVFVGQNFLDSGKIPEPKIETESKIFEETSPPQVQSPQGKYETEKIDWGEIKIPDAENFSPPSSQIQSPPQIPPPEIFEPVEPQTSKESKKKSDPRLNRVCTLTLNGEIYSEGVGEIPAQIWQNWRSDGENIYLPENFSVSVILENKNSEPLNVSVEATLTGLQRTEKIFPPANLLSGQQETFEIPIGGLACINGIFEVTIFLRADDETPLTVFWNEKNFSNSQSVKIYLRDYAKTKYG